MSDKMWQEFLRTIEQVRAIHPRAAIELRDTDSDDLAATGGGAAALAVLLLAGAAAASRRRD